MTLGDLLLENRIVFVGSSPGDRRQPGHHRLPRQRHHPEAAVPAVREQDRRHPHVHQQPRRSRVRDAGDLRHDAVPGSARSTPTAWAWPPAGPRSSWRPARRASGYCPAELEGDDPPALRPGRRPGLRHRDPGQRDPQGTRSGSTRSSPSTPASRSTSSRRKPIATSTSTPTRPRRSAWWTRCW